MTKTNSGKKFLLILQTGYLTSFTANDTAPKRSYEATKVCLVSNQSFLKVLSNSSKQMYLIKKDHIINSQGKVMLFY